MRYQNKHWGFKLDFPAGWFEPGFFKRLFSSGRYAQQDVYPEFYGPEGASIKIMSGPISPVPSTEQQINLKTIAEKHGHDVIETGTIKVGGISHATMTCRIPDAGVLKNYSLIFGRTEHFITARGDWQECDSIIKTFKVAQ